MDRMNDQIVVTLKDESGLLSRIVLCIDVVEVGEYCCDLIDGSDSEQPLGLRSMPSYLSSDKAIPMYSSGAEYLAMIVESRSLMKFKGLGKSGMKELGGNTLTSCHVRSNHLPWSRCDL